MKYSLFSFLHLSRHDRRGMLLLLVLLLPLLLLRNSLYARLEEEGNTPDTVRVDTSQHLVEATVSPLAKEHPPVPASQKRKPAASVLVAAPAPVQRYPKAEKYPERTVIELNQADTTQLKKIPGIGGYIARRIVDYRNRLGGYYHIGQLGEIRLRRGQPAEWFMIDTLQIQKWFTIDTLYIKRIHVNQISVDSLAKHPYFNTYRAKALVAFRTRHGRVDSLKQLLVLRAFTEIDLERITPYVCCE